MTKMIHSITRVTSRPAIFILLLSLVALLLTGLAPLQVEDPKPKDEEKKTEKAKLGEKVPDFTLRDLDERERALADFKDRIIVLEWTNPDCPYVQNLYRSQAMQKAQAKVKELDSKLAWIAISTTDGMVPKRLEFWKDQYKIQNPVLMDTMGKVGRMYDARTTPHMFVIDAKGVLRYHGAIDDNALSTKRPDEVVNYVVQAVRQIVNDEVVSPDHVKPYGCAVKYPR